MQKRQKNHIALLFTFNQGTKKAHTKSESVVYAIIMHTPKKVCVRMYMIDFQIAWKNALWHHQFMVEQFLTFTRKRP